jgi:hypothetical protein
MQAPKLPAPPVGWPLLPTPEDGTLSYPTLEESVRQSIRVILLTRPGEQLMRPEFGAGLDRFLHEPNTLLTRRRVRDAIVEALGRWEPRIITERVEVWESEERADAVRVEIVYRIKRTGGVTSLMLTMSLGS